MHHIYVFVCLCVGETEYMYFDFWENFTFANHNYAIAMIIYICAYFASTTIALKRQNSEKEKDRGTESRNKKEE